MLVRLAIWLVAFWGFASAAQAQQAVRRDDAQFVGSSSGQVYYWIGCDDWKRLSSRNLRFFRTAADAERAGFRPSQTRGCAPQLDTALIRPTNNGTAECVVTRIVDGDTFTCGGGNHVRLLIADTDEIGQSVYADSAVMLLARLIPVGTRVRLEFDIDGYDRNRRLLAYVYAGALFVNRELVRRGFAQIAAYPPNVREVDAMRAAADSARRDRLGVWRSRAFECAPADYRSGRCRYIGQPLGELPGRGPRHDIVLTWRGPGCSLRYGRQDGPHPDPRYAQAEGGAQAAR
jgi:endonuclease YncB( thermonuclease family)